MSICLLKRLHFDTCTLNHIQTDKKIEQYAPKHSCIHTLCLIFPTKRVLMVSSAANRTDLMLCRKKGQSLGTSSVREVLLPDAVSCWETEGHDRIPASNIIMLFVEAVKSSRSTKVSHKVTRTSCTCQYNV